MAVRKTLPAQSAFVSSWLRTVSHCPAIAGNHMTCRSCGQDWCWICGSKCGGGGVPTHYAWWNIFGCPGTQMQNSYQHWSCCGQFGLRCGLLVYKLLMLVLVPPLALAGMALVIACLPGLIISVPVVYCCCQDECDDEDTCYWMLLVRKRASCRVAFLVQRTASGTHILAWATLQTARSEL